MSRACFLAGRVASIAFHCGSAIAQPWGPPECRVKSLSIASAYADLKALVHSSIDDPEIASGTIRRAGGMNPIDGPKYVPNGTFSGDDHEFSLSPELGDWNTTDLYLFEFYVEHDGTWYKTIVAFKYLYSGGIDVWDVYEQSGTIV